MRPYIDKGNPEAWNAASAYSSAISDAVAAHGLTHRESELISLRASQLNGCAFCINLHSHEAREAGIPQQKIDLLPVWRETQLFTARETAVLMVAEAASRLPLTEQASADLAAAREELGDDTFVAAEWVAATINLFNRISILSQHKVRERK